MDEKIELWLKENVDKYRNSDGRVRVGALENAIENVLGTGVENVELYAWLEKNKYVNPEQEYHKRSEKMGNKVGWPKGRSRKGQRRGAVKAVVSATGSFEARIIDGKIYIPFDEAERIFGNGK